MKDYVFRIGAGESLPVSVGGNFIGAVSGSVRVRAGDSEYQLSEGQGVQDVPFFDALELINDDSTEKVVSLKIGQGRFFDNRIDLKKKKIRALDKIVADGLPYVVPANAQRVKIGFQVSRANSGHFWFGGEIEKGFKLAPGDYVLVEVQEAISILGDTLGDEVFCVEEVYI